MAQSKWIYGGGAVLLAGLIVWAVTSVPEIPQQTDEPTGPRIMSYMDNTLHEAKQIKWTAAEGSLTAEGDAELIRDDMRATGDRIVSTDGFQKFSIFGNARIEKGGAK